MSENDETDEIILDELEDEELVLQMHDDLYDGLKDIEEVYVNGDMTDRYCANLNISFAYVEGESLMMALKALSVPTSSLFTPAVLLLRRS